MPTTETTGPKRSIATVCLSGTLEDKLIAAAEAGFDGVEIFENDLLASADSPETVRERCRDLGLTIDLYQPFRDFEAVPPDLLEAGLRRAEQKFGVCERLGADTVLVCSSVSPDTVDDDDLAAEHLNLLASRAAEHGIRIAYEALAWGRFVNTYDHSWRIVRRGDHPNLGLCLDSFHILSRGSDPSGIRVIPGEKLFFLQLADAPQLSMDVLQWSRHHRLFPGQGAFDLTRFLDLVLTAGYDGPLSLEVFNDVFRQSEPHQSAIDALRSLVTLQESVTRGGSERARARARIEDLPAPPRTEGFAFTEIGVDDRSEADVVGALAGLGFTHTAQHRSKPVQLWEQGEARILVNASADDPATGETAVTALAVENADPTASAHRAERLLAPILPREHRADEADLASVTAPNGTAVFFCRTDAREGWLHDFSPTPNPAGPGTGLRAIDHVGLTQPFDHFDGAALFYRSILGLQPEAPAEVAAPFGLIRSLSIADAAKRVRIALSVSVLRRGEWSPEVRDPQHIAFASQDVIASAAKARDLGLDLLEIPANYHDDLEARFALPTRLMDDLREHSLMYDRDEDGEFLHFYTPVLGSRVFLEVVQRIGAYAGYGMVNAPIRMAAHRRHRRADRLERDA
ncbi:sugar phosphate isomerase/epimerase and 4-hydroxyphenylpyruvate domain-containing protein [Glycomyces buryatensis]|uniref:3-dehydroshikimate dehydratase n=1 Tax=Glycomyces buryatensis TaxID=2570927 RepID=A0A4S8PXN7_9ACTN|nr:sugar phosphate isomerase/epimerase and 4-hydroxyphenylpyruvate domain-containing protein [Glycomyces buryatensis]THV36380.1 sugar phosphate isomerase/epimerase and 4-hydroxyphenylpyruvate domain-containing protein [Glycomyces buryatensis]